MTPVDRGAHPDAPQAWLEVGRIGRPHGLRGDALVTLSTDRPERLDPGTRLRAGSVALEVARSQPYQDRWLVHFREGLDKAALTPEQDEQFWGYVTHAAQFMVNELE